MLIRQGDLILRRVADATDGPTTTVTLAVGEESGHSHVVEARLVRDGLIDVPLHTTLRVAGMPWRHEAIEVSAGRYSYWVQRELTEDEELEEARRVQD